MPPKAEGDFMIDARPISRRYQKRPDSEARKAKQAAQGANVSDTAPNRFQDARIQLGVTRRPLRDE